MVITGYRWGLKYRYCNCTKLRIETVTKNFMMKIILIEMMMVAIKWWRKDYNINDHDDNNDEVRNNKDKFKCKKYIKAETNLVKALPCK